MFTLSNLFLLAEWQARGRLLRWCAGLGEGQHSLSPPTWCPGQCLSHPCLGVSRWHLVHEQLLVFLLLRGSDFENNLCCHLGDITFYFFVVQLKTCQFVYLYKKLLVSLIFVYFFLFGPYLFHYDLCNCLSFPNFGLIFLFLVPLGVELDGLFESICFLYSAFIIVNHLQELCCSIPVFLPCAVFFVMCFRCFLFSV